MMKLIKSLILSLVMVVDDECGVMVVPASCFKVPCLADFLLINVSLNSFL